NGALVASYYGTGTSRATANGNTRNSGISGVRFVRYGSSAANISFNRSYDDIVINNALGTVNNDFLGDVRVIGLLPTAVGTNSQLARTGGTSAGNYTAVNEN